MQHQDWSVVNGGHGSSTNRTKTREDQLREERMARRSGLVHVALKPKVMPNMNAKKLDNETETFKSQYIDHAIGKKITALRVANTCTQKALAQRANLPLKDVQDIETGKAMKNGKTHANIQKLLRILETKN